MAAIMSIAQVAGSGTGDIRPAAWYPPAIATMFTVDPAPIFIVAAVIESTVRFTPSPTPSVPDPVT